MSWNFRGRAGSSPDSTMNTSLEIACVYCQVVRESSAHRQYGRGLFSLALQEASNLITATCEFTVCPHDLPSLSPSLSFTFHLLNQTPSFVTAVLAPVNCYQKSKRRYLHNRWNFIEAAVFARSPCRSAPFFTPAGLFLQGSVWRASGTSWDEAKQAWWAVHSTSSLSVTSYFVHPILMHLIIPIKGHYNLSITLTHGTTLMLVTQ